MPDNVVAGKYRILRRLAAGGMGEVCLAAQVGPAGYERVVALKRMLPSLSVDRELLKLFLDEARLVAQLNHRNICQIIELGEDNEGYFVAMEMVHGPSVNDLLERLRKGVVLLDPFYAIDIAAQVAEALSYAYTAPGRDGQPLRIIHRDVTPHNILLSTSGDVKLIDFGVAKSSQQQHSTESGTVKGKMGYLSPEQSMGRPLDGRSDLFAVGIMLYEMVTLSNPFARADMMAMVRSIQLEEVPPLSSINPVWAPFDPVIHRLLAKLPEHRYPDAQTAAEALQDLRPRFPRPPKRLGLFVAEHFGSDLAELVKSVGLSEARQELEGTLPSSGPKRAIAPELSAEVEAARGNPTLYISGPKAATPSPTSGLGSAAVSDDSVVRRALPRSSAATVVGAVGIAGLVAGGVWLGFQKGSASPGVAPATPQPVQVALAAPSPAPTAIAAATPPPPTPREDPHPVAAPAAVRGSSPPVQVATSETPHRGSRKHSPHSEGDEGPTPTAAPAALAPVPAATPTLGTLHVTGMSPQVVRAPTGHLEVKEGQYQVALDYSVSGGQLHAKLATQPWAIVSLNGVSSGKTKEGPVDLGPIGGSPVRIELDHPDVEHGKLVMTFESR